VADEDVRDALLRNAPAIPAAGKPARCLLERRDAMDMFLAKDWMGEMFKPTARHGGSGLTIVESWRPSRAKGYNAAAFHYAYIFASSNHRNNIAERDQIPGAPIVNCHWTRVQSSPAIIACPFVVKITKMWRSSAPGSGLHAEPGRSAQGRRIPIACR